MNALAHEVAVRLPPVPSFTQQLHAAYGCRVGWGAQGVLLFVFVDLAADTMLAWERWLFPHLTDLHFHARGERHFYDMRQVRQPTLAGLQTAIRVNQNPGVKWVRTAILTEYSPMSAAIETVMRNIPHANARLFNQEAAVWTWLQQPFD